MPSQKSSLRHPSQERTAKPRPSPSWTRTSPLLLPSCHHQPQTVERQLQKTRIFHSSFTRKRRMRPSADHLRRRVEKARLGSSPDRPRPLRWYGQRRAMRPLSVVSYRCACLCTRQHPCDGNRLCQRCRPSKRRHLLQSWASRRTSQLHTRRRIGRCQSHSRVNQAWPGARCTRS